MVGASPEARPQILIAPQETLLQECRLKEYFVPGLFIDAQQGVQPDASDARDN